MGTMTEIGISGYLATPAVRGPWPAVIVIQEWWGLDAQTKSIADRFAGLGYLAFAPDLFHGELAKLGDHETAMGLTHKYGPGAEAELEHVYDALKSYADCNGKIGTVGFCFGGRMSLVLGIKRPLDALCTFYGGGMQEVFDRLGGLKSPVLGLYGDQDRSIPAGTIDELKKILDKLGVDHEVVIYPNAGHAFMRDADPTTYRPDAAKDAWERAKKFLEKHLR